MILPIYRKGSRFSCENHRGISFVSITPKLLGTYILQIIYYSGKVHA